MTHGNDGFGPEPILCGAHVALTARLVILGLVILLGSPVVQARSELGFSVTGGGAPSLLVEVGGRDFAGGILAGGRSISGGNLASLTTLWLAVYGRLSLSVGLFRPYLSVGPLLIRSQITSQQTGPLDPEYGLGFQAIAGIELSSGSTRIPISIATAADLSSCPALGYTYAGSRATVLTWQLSIRWVF